MINVTDKLKIKNQRWADVMRKELSNPSSLTSQAVRKFNAMKVLCESNPKRYKLRLEPFGNIVFVEKGQKFSISLIPDVGYLFR